MKVFFITVILAVASLQAHGLNWEYDSFMEENNYWIPEGAAFTNKDINEEIFNLILDKAEAVYKPIFAEQGANFIVERKWSDGTVNAYAYQRGRDRYIAMFGGLARHEATTPDGFALVVCHEIGHHLGGAPKGSWASNEGQSDYWGTLKCLRRMWEYDDNFAMVNYLWQIGHFTLDDIALESCQAAHEAPHDQAICVRATAAGISLGTLLASLRGKPAPKLDTPDTTQVGRTSDSHPNAQCRLDTYFHGALCPIDFNIPTDDRDPTIGACNRVDGWQYGIRSRCWYKPPTDSFYPTPF